eukprot:2266650-Amphidinium_carterae.1
MAWSKATRGSRCGPPLAIKSTPLLRFPTHPSAFLAGFGHAYDLTAVQGHGLQGAHYSGPNRLAETK